MKLIFSIGFPFFGDWQAEHLSRILSNIIDHDGSVEIGISGAMRNKSFGEHWYMHLYIYLFLLTLTWLMIQTPELEQTGFKSWVFWGQLPGILYQKLFPFVRSFGKYVMCVYRIPGTLVCILKDNAYFITLLWGL